MARKKAGPQIFPHTSIRIDDGDGNVRVLKTGDESELSETLDKKQLDVLQNKHGAIGGFVANARDMQEHPDLPDNSTLRKTDAGGSVLGGVSKVSSFEDDDAGEGAE